MKVEEIQSLLRGILIQGKITNQKYITSPSIAEP